MSFIPQQQYDEGEVDTTIRGTAVMFEDAGDTLRPPSASFPFPVTVLSGGGGGTQYTEGDTDASITGTAIMWEDGSDTVRAVSAAKPLPISDAGGSVTVDGTVSLGAGTADVGSFHPFAQPSASVDGKTSDITNTTDTAIIAAQGASVRTYLTHIIVQNSHATVSTWVMIKDGSTGRYPVYAAAGGGGASITLPKPLRGTANTAWNAACETTGANVRVSASGYTSTT